MLNRASLEVLLLTRVKILLGVHKVPENGLVAVTRAFKKEILALAINLGQSFHFEKLENVVHLLFLLEDRDEIRRVAFEILF